jgi:uncharacterized membrane protein YqiK
MDQERFCCKDTSGALVLVLVLVAVAVAVAVAILVLVLTLTLVLVRVTPVGRVRQRGGFLACSRAGSAARLHWRWLL